MHQIRAILGWILLVLKGVVPLDFTNIALNGPFIFRVPLVSPSGSSREFVSIHYLSSLSKR
jgi:hypothetical protein